MKVIENKKTAIHLNDDELATYADLLAHLLNRPSTKGISVKEMRRDLKLLDILEAAGDTIELPNADADFLADLAIESVWGVRHKDFVAFYEYFEALKGETV